MFILNVGSEVSNIEGVGDVDATYKVYLVGIISYPLHNLVNAFSSTYKLSLPS